MKARIFITSLVLMMLSAGIIKPSFSQSCYSPVIDSIVSRVTIESIRKSVRELSGDTSCVIEGIPYTILTRAYNFDGNEMAAKYILERFSNYGLITQSQVFSSTGKNVIGIKTGAKYPHRFFVLCAHYDSYPWEARSPGADDNASGIAAVLEAAKLLNNYSTDYTIKFIGFDEEERGLFGSIAYADSCELSGDTLIGVMNMDMLGWDAYNNNRVALYSAPNSRSLAEIALSSIQYYVPGINAFIKNGYISDDFSFYQRGYKTVCPWEDPSNIYINTLADSIQLFNLPYFRRMVQCVVSGISTLGFDYLINFSHEPVVSGNDTTSRTAIVTVKSNHPLGEGNNACRLFYKVNGSAYQALNYVYHNLDTFKFEIPSQSPNSTVSYYFASQDSLGLFFATYPGGGKENVPPNSTYTYFVTLSVTVCSNTVPVPIPPQHFIYDSIRITQDYILGDLDVNVTINHPVDQNLFIYLINPEGTYVQLSNAHGDSGANYINTVFDDEAADSIKNGTPPFTGHFVPDFPLRVLDNRSMRGAWRLKVVNGSTTYTGQLVSWCLNANFVYPIGLVQNQVPVKFSLLQNYPNPFNPVTNIRYSLPKRSMVNVTVYDVIGKEVKVLVNEIEEPGSHNITFDGSSYASGVYFYRIEAGEFTEVMKMVLIK